MTQAIQDALADAETLRDYLALRARIESNTMRVNMMFGHPAPATADYLDVRDGAKLCPAHYGAEYAADTDAKMARYWAHAAFRAVPGLRG